MFLKILVLFSLYLTIMAHKYPCSRASAAMTLRRPAYEFSINILDRVSEETDGHFVFSPLSTWLQLIALAEGARGSTLNEIWEVTKHHRVLCFRRKLREFINEMDEELKYITERSSVLVFDKLYKVKNSYIREIEKSKTTRVLSVDFAKGDAAAHKVNDLIQLATKGVIKEAVTPEDFNYTILLIIDAVYFKSAWKTPFNPAYTNTEPFYADEGISIGQVEMMNQIGYFNFTEISGGRTKVLEIPCNRDNRISLLIFLPTKGSIREIFLYLKSTRLGAIHNKFRREGEKLVNIKIPKFKINTDIDSIPELLHDMGIKRIFYPDTADLKGISDYKVHTSLMTQIADFAVNEQGVTGSVIAEYLIFDKNQINFVANKPFAFILVDKKSDIILFAGMYSKPEN